MRLVEVHQPADMDTVRALFREYEKWLDVDLCFQGFEQELAALPGDYAPPRGRILLAQADDQVAGCVALRPIDNDTCEMKRLFVREPYRGTGLGKRLVLACAETGRALGYMRMRLDTLPKMQAAIGLYRALGFRDIPQYRPNPVPGALYLEVALENLPNKNEPAA